MGCTTSKHSPSRDGWNAPLSRSMSVPTSRAGMEGDTYNMISSQYGISRPDRSGDDLGSYVGMSGKQQECVQRMSSSKLKPVIEEELWVDHDEHADTINTWELMEGLEEDVPGKRTPSSLGTFEARRRRLLERSASFHTVQEVDAQFRFSVWRKCINDDDCGKDNAKPLDKMMLTPPAKQPFNPVSPSRSFNPVSPSRSFSSRESVDGNTGLRLLLNPAATPSPSLTSPRTGATLNKSLSSNGRFSLSFDGDNFSGFPRAPDIIRSPSKSNNTPSRPEWMATSGSFKEPNSPLFDPTIIATFEKALEAASDDSWQSSDVSMSTSSENTSSSSETSSDADSPQLTMAGSVDLERSDFIGPWAAREQKLCKGIGNSFQDRGDVVYNKKKSFSKISPLDFDERKWKNLESLESFELKCPPGCEGKVVLYFTSLRGVRKTFEDCCNLRMILQGMRMHVDERDVWMHSKFRQELTDVLGELVSVPRLFIKGRYIGGAEEVKQLHEEGILAKLLEGLPTERGRKVCDGCGDVRFIPCITCSGSCKMIIEGDKKLRCPDCNENGLIMCPWCMEAK